MDLKPQDIVFIIVLILLFIKRDPRLFAVLGLICLGLSIPLFYQWIFFTAQRLVIYAFFFLTFSVFFNAFKLRADYKTND